MGNDQSLMVSSSPSQNKIGDTKVNIENVNNSDVGTHHFYKASLVFTENEAYNQKTIGEENAQNISPCQSPEIIKINSKAP